MKAPRAVVLGGYGLIGSALMRALAEAGYDVTGVGRSAHAAQTSNPDAMWLIRDIGTTTAAEWSRDLGGVDVVVNASGALQDGARDTLKAIHHDALVQLTEALTRTSTRFIQISAAGVSTKASTAFMRSKAQGDNVLMASDLAWVILRPTLVMAPAAYGGTALLRAAAATPLIGLQTLPLSEIQTVALEDLATAVVQAARGDIPPGTLADLTAADVHSFADLTVTMRRWLGFAPWRITLSLPDGALRLIGRGADVLGHMGWRAPLRSTALEVLKDGIRGDPAPWAAAGGTPCRSLDATLSRMPATVQDRWFARLFLLVPLAIGLLSVFWCLSGLIGMLRWQAASEVLTGRGYGSGFAIFSVWIGACLDLILGIAVLWRRWTRSAALGMIALSLAYLGMGSLLTPDLWADPLGPFVKVLPGIGLAAFVASLTEDR